MGSNIRWIFCYKDLLEQDIPFIFVGVKEVTIMRTAVIYARVSSSNDRQNTQRQIEDLTLFASRNEYQSEQKREECKEVIALLKKGYSVRNVAKLSGVSVSTVQRIKKEFLIKKTNI